MDTTWKQNASNNLPG